MLLFFQQTAYPAAIRIMPLGDSITVGISSGVIPDNSQYYVSYRKALRDRLVTAGYEINYVGNELAGNGVFADAQQEGHGEWFETVGPAVALSGATSARPTFLAPSAVESEVVLAFSLAVKDRGGLQSTDFCTVTVSPNQGSSGSGGGGGCLIITAGSEGGKRLSSDLK
jgi:hypothetical protein